jgi:hypothetical protein
MPYTLFNGLPHCPQDEGIKAHIFEKNDHLLVATQWSERVVSFEVDVDMIMGSSRLSFGIFNKRGRIYNSIFFGNMRGQVGLPRANLPGFPHSWVDLRWQGAP